MLHKHNEKENEENSQYSSVGFDNQDSTTESTENNDNGIPKIVEPEDTGFPFENLNQTEPLNQDTKIGLGIHEEHLEEGEVQKDITDTNIEQAGKDTPPTDNSSPPPNQGIDPPEIGENNNGIEDVGEESIDGSNSNNPPPSAPVEKEGFKDTIEDIGTESEQLKEHQTANFEAQKSRKGATFTAEEEEGMEDGEHVGLMNEQEAGQFDAVQFKNALISKLGKTFPKDEDDAKDFVDENRISGVSESVEGDVTNEKDNAANSIESTTDAEPQDIPKREVETVKPPELGKHPKPVNTDKAVPDPVGVERVEKPLEEKESSVEELMKEKRIDDDLLANSNESSFQKVLTDKNNAKTTTEQSKVTYRQEEDQQLKETKTNVHQNTTEGLGSAFAKRGADFLNVETQQHKGANEHSAERQRIANEINEIYTNTQTDVQDILDSLDTTVKDLFEEASNKANKAFNNYVGAKMKAFFTERYNLDESWLSWDGALSRIGGGLKAIGDVWKLPEEIKAFFHQGRELYMESMDASLTHISEVVTQQLNAAKARIAKGRQEVNEYVGTLEPNLQNIGKEISNGIQSRFDELDQSVDAKHEELVDYLVAECTNAVTVLDEKIEKLENLCDGLWGLVKKGLEGVFAPILEAYNTISSLLGRAGDALWTIVTNPMESLDNIIQGLGAGLNNFVGNIGQHLINGVIDWLMGEVSEIDIEIPEDLFSLEGILDLVIQVLGVSWDNVRDKLADEFGEDVIGRIERGFQFFQDVREKGFIGAITDYMLAEAEAIKGMLLDELRNYLIEEIVNKGIQFLMAMLTPAGAFLKAIETIINIVQFFVDNWDTIITMVEAFVETVEAVANGNIGVMATAIENAMASTIPSVIGFLASLLNLDKLGEKIQGVVENIRKEVDAMITKIVQKAGDWLGSKSSKERKEEEAKNKENEDDRDPAQLKADFGKAMAEGEIALNAKDKTEQELKSSVDFIEQKYKMDKLSATVERQEEKGEKSEEQATEIWTLSGELGENTDSKQIKRPVSKAENEDEVSDEDREKHKQIANEIEDKLTSTETEGEENFEDFYTRISSLVKELAVEYQKQLREGINLTIELLNSIKQDEKDGDVDIEINIIPNETRRSTKIAYGDEDNNKLPEQYTIDPPFTIYQGNPNDFKRQLKMQEDGINDMEVNTWIKNRKNYLREGRTEDGISELRNIIREDIATYYIEQNGEMLLSEGKSDKEIDKLAITHAKSILTKNDAILHNPDQVAGGQAFIRDLYQEGSITDKTSAKASKLIGHGGANSSIGAQWRGKRIDRLHNNTINQFKNIHKRQKNKVKMNVLLKYN